VEKKAPTTETQQPQLGGDEIAKASVSLVRADATRASGRDLRVFRRSCWYQNNLFSLGEGWFHLLSNALIACAPKCFITHHVPLPLRKRSWNSLISSRVQPLAGRVFRGPKLRDWKRRWTANDERIFGLPQSCIARNWARSDADFIARWPLWKRNISRRQITKSKSPVKLFRIS
jgi:hypothetical protein